MAGKIHSSPQMERLLLTAPLVASSLSIQLCSIMRARKDRVTLLSGGDSGHEPAHAGYVGEGMLDAAVCGVVFASPNSLQVEAGLRLIESPRGILVIIKNYTGDKLNFTLAAERYRFASGIPVKLVVMADDVSIGRTKSALVGRRGLAGTVLVHKIAGAASAANLGLDEVADAAEFAIANMGTIGTGAATTYTGCAGGDMLSSILDVTDVERNYLTSIPQQGGHGVVLLVNNLGGLSTLEVVAVTGEVVSQLSTNYQLNLSRVYTGTFLSALNGPGFSITILALPKSEPLSSRILQWLEAPTDALGDPVLFTSIFKFVHSSLVAAELEITRMDTIMGDGDCGTTLLSGPAAVIAALDDKTINAASLSNGMMSVANAIARISMSGTSGALYAVFFTALASAIYSSYGTHRLAGFPSPVKAVNVALGNLETLSARIDSSPLDALEQAVTAAESGRQSTSSMQSKFGRSTYVSAEGEAGAASGIPDPGACGVVAIVTGVRNALKAHCSK